VNGGWAISTPLLLPSISKAHCLLDVQPALKIPIVRYRTSLQTTSTIQPHHYPLFTMASSSRYYYSLPTDAPQRSRSGSRRPPLTPSTVSSPCLTTHAYGASRRDSSGSSGSPTKASVLLAKVASSPGSPRSETRSASPMPSPETRMHSSYSHDRPVMWRSESDRYVRQYRQQGKQISTKGWHYQY
jgi:hypothetical protein